MMRKEVLMVVGFFAVLFVLANLSVKITGNAVSAAYTCSDSDGGRNPNVPGTVTSTAGSYSDSCKDVRTLHENYCKGNVRRMETVPCLSGCSKGACLR